MKNPILLIMATGILAVSCSDRNELSDAYGNFEATEIIISAESQGTIELFTIQEGRQYPAGHLAGIIDSSSLYLQKEQLWAQKQAVTVKKEGIRAQIEVLKEQQRVLMVEKERLEKLFSDGAATRKQMDDLNGQLSTMEKQVQATETNFLSINAEVYALSKQEDRISDLLSRCRIINPVEGTVLEKYIEPDEMAVPGKSLYKIADLSKMQLRVYISGDQLSSVRLGQKVRVFIDGDDNSRQELEGLISWISDKAEFTPKIIQTKKERVNLVYALKVEVINDGRLKIGMPGDVIFSEEL